MCWKQKLVLHFSHIICSFGRTKNKRSEETIKYGCEIAGKWAPIPGYALDGNDGTNETVGITEAIDDSQGYTDQQPLAVDEEAIRPFVHTLETPPVQSVAAANHNSQIYVYEPQEVVTNPIDEETIRLSIPALEATTLVQSADAILITENEPANASVPTQPRIIYLQSFSCYRAEYSFVEKI